MGNEFQGRHVTGLYSQSVTHGENLICAPYLPYWPKRCLISACSGHHVKALLVSRFILRKKPHVIVIGGESREALTVKADVSEVVQQLVEDEQFPRLPIEIADNHVSKIYSNSIRGRVRDHCTQTNILKFQIRTLYTAVPLTQILFISWLHATLSM